MNVSPDHVSPRQPGYRSHWSEILAMVHKMRDEQKCWQMLGAIPLHLRDDTERGALAQPFY